MSDEGGFEGLAISDGDEDVQAAAPSTLVRIAGRVSTLAGVFSIVLGLQSFVNIRLVGFFAIAPFAQILLGLGLAICGWMLSRGRGWAAIGSAALGAVTVLSTIVFSVTALLGGYVTLMPVFVIISGVAGAVMAGVGIGECLRADKARERLAAQGLDMGL